MSFPFEEDISSLAPKVLRELERQGMVLPARAVELTAPEHEHHWQPAHFEGVRYEMRGLEEVHIPAAIIALCPCGATKRIEVPA